MKAFLAAMFAAVTVQAQNEIIKIDILEPTTMCSRFACVKLAVGEAGIYNNNFIDGKKLAYGTLNEVSVIGSIAFPAGTLVKFQTPAQEDYDGMDFSVVYREDQKLSGVTFLAGTEVSFDRFRQVYLPVEKKLAQIEHDHGFMKVKGVSRDEITIQNLTVKTLIFESFAHLINKHTIADLKIAAGLVSRDSVYPAETPIALQADSFIRVYRGPYSGMNVSRVGGFTVEPYGFKVSSATYRLPSGQVSAANVTHPAQVQGYQVLGDVSFHENGLLELFSPMPDVMQQVEGVTIDGTDSYYFDVEFHKTGHALTVPTNNVRKNLALLSEEIAYGLPDSFQENHGRLQFFFNPTGKLRALVVEPGFVRPTRPTQIFLVSGELGSYKYQLLDKADRLGLKIRSSTRGYVEFEVVDYLTFN